jgi:hypothetical protein
VPDMAYGERAGAVQVRRANHPPVPRLQHPVWHPASK